MFSMATAKGELGRWYILESQHWEGGEGLGARQILDRRREGKGSR